MLTLVGMYLFGKIMEDPILLADSIALVSIRLMLLEVDGKAYHALICGTVVVRPSDGCVISRYLVHRTGSSMSLGASMIRDKHEPASVLYNQQPSTGLSLRV